MLPRTPASGLSFKATQAAPPVVLFTNRVTPEVITSFKRLRHSVPADTVFMASGLSGFNGSYVHAEAAQDPTGDAAEFLRTVKRVDVKSYGMTADRMMQAALACVRQQDQPAMQRTYSDWPFTKVGRIRDLIAAESKQPMLEALAANNNVLVSGWKTFVANMTKRTQAYIDVHAAAEAGDHEQARRIFEASQAEFKISSDDDLNLEGSDSPFMLRMCGGNSEFLQHITEQRYFAKPGEGPHHGFRALTKAPYSFLGSTADVAAFLWIVTHRSNDPATFGEISLAQFAQHVDPILVKLQQAGGLSWFAQQYGVNLPVEWHEDAELDDVRAWAIGESLAALAGRRIRRVSYLHPAVLSNPGFARPACVDELVACDGTSATNQLLGMTEYCACQGCTGSRCTSPRSFL